jgi:hypothetical protein
MTDHDKQKIRVSTRTFLNLLLTIPVESVRACTTTQLSPLSFFVFPVVISKEEMESWICLLQRKKGVARETEKDSNITV